MYSGSFGSLMYDCVDGRSVCPPAHAQIFNLCFRALKVGPKRAQTRPIRTSDEQCWLVIQGLNLRGPSRAICKTLYAQIQPRTHITTCHHRPPFPAHQIGSAGIGKDLNAAGCYILGDVVDSQLLDLDAHCHCPDYADWLATAGGVCYHGVHFHVRSHP